ncbi:inositol monophosphatase family protein [Magnetospira thiophila]
MSPDPAKVLQIINQVAAQEVRPRFQNLSKLDIWSKSGPQDLCTTADLASEKALSAHLTALLPGSGVVGEEATSKDPDLLTQLREDRPVWVLDPVDGTNNFAQGRPNFAMIVALCRGGDILAGWIHSPLDGRTIWALKGQGAWCDQRPLRLAPLSSMEGLRAALNRTQGRRIKTLAEQGRSGLPRVVPRMFCAGCEYMALAEGHLHISSFDRLKPWDHAAGVLIHREAGGFDGQGSDGAAYRPDGPLSGQLILAPDQDTWKTLSALLGDG